MALPTLHNRIRQYLEKGLKETKLDTRTGMKLWPVVGNGLTRFAGAPSWDDWVKEALVQIGEKPERFESLRRQKFDHPEILHFIFQRASQLGTEEAIWSRFGRNLLNLQPISLHMALAAMADRHMLTTNYDVLLEKAAYEVGRYDPKYVLDPLNETQKKLPTPYPPSRELVIWKLHGSLPSPSVEGKMQPALYQKWLKNQGYKNLIATSSSYRGAALTTDLPHLTEISGDLEKENNLFLLLGTSLTSAELVLLRLLYRRWGSPKNLFVLNISGPAERQIRFAELGINTLDLPKGLAGNPMRRILAFSILLEILLDRIELQNEEQKSKATRFLKAARDELASNSLTQTAFADTVPIVGCVGPIQTSRVIGLTDPAQQETAHSPAMATRVPHTKIKEVLISDASMGQAGNPVIVWDAMNLPVALLAEIGDDDAGSNILERLQQMKYLDFDGVLQLLPTAEHQSSPGCATESFTCVTWFGVRTLFDSLRFEKSSRCTPSQWERELEKIKHVPMWYLTKTWSREFKGLFDKHWTSEKPLFVFETGGTGARDFERWVADKHGVLIASAKTALRWIDKDKDLGSDEFGRYIQLARLINNLKNEHEYIIKGPLRLARAIVITLGELGALWWRRKGTRWSQTMWTFPASLEQNGSEKVRFKHAVSLPLGEIRDALGCGDCARAGFVVSLARSLRFGPPYGDLRREDVILAVSSLCWFGTQKIRYFGMDRYAKFLRDNAESFWRWWSAAATSSQVAPYTVQLGAEDFETFHTYALPKSERHDLLMRWQNRFDPGDDEAPIEKNRMQIRTMALRWRKRRNLEETRKIQ